jgi:hypothetical protein
VILEGLGVKQPVTTMSRAETRVAPRREKHRKVSCPPACQIHGQIGAGLRHVRQLRERRTERPFPRPAQSGIERRAVNRLVLRKPGDLGFQLAGDSRENFRGRGIHHRISPAEVFLVARQQPRLDAAINAREETVAVFRRCRLLQHPFDRGENPALSPEIFQFVQPTEQGLGMLRVFPDVRPDREFRVPIRDPRQPATEPAQGPALDRKQLRESRQVLIQAQGGW